ncbi:MAG: carboxypeptidase-like regulatory domain-containing protein [Acidobacteriota bacterium]|nr:carboxypeptidase-like regulatory domain-containing protein [Acidobacteriota bacterium]
MQVTFSRLHLFLICLALSATSFGSAQKSDGRLIGKIVDADGKAAIGVVVMAANQTDSRTESKRTDTEGNYAFRLRTGAYRISVQPPFEARFERGKAEEYGVFSNVICDESKKFCPILENIIIEGDTERKIDFNIVRPEKEVVGNSDEAPDRESPIFLTADRREVRDRWRIDFPEYDRYGDKGARGRDIPFRRNRWYNPYDQNILKGDYPVFGDDYFLIISGVSTTGIEIRRTPAGTNVSSDNPDSNNFFGRPESLSFNQTIQLSFEFFRGQTVFKPRGWAIKISPTFSIPNYLNARENGVVNIDVRRGTNRTDMHVSLEEAFAEVKLLDTNDNYDSVSVRGGIQPFSADFRGFLYSDNNLGVRFFGAFSNNKSQFNLAYFRQLEKDTNSNLNSLETPRHQNIYIANYFRQDFLVKGYTLQGVAAYNDDRDDIHYDTNGFLVRPALVGSARPHSIKAGYVGINGDGHIGWLNLSNSYYFAFGEDDFNPIAGRRTQIRAHMAAVEASIDRDWLRYRASIFYASGDKNPTDNRAQGFDAIFDDPNFVGGQFSYWNRQGIRLVSTEIGLVQPNSLLPSIRSSKTEGQANFVNPGILIFNAGVDAEVTQTMKAVFNANYLRFDRTESLEYVLFQPRVRHEIGYDLSLGVVYRPLLINNLTFTFGGNILLPGRGFRDVFTDRARNCPIPVFCTADVPNPSKPQYTLFSQMKLVF